MKTSISHLLSELIQRGHTQRWIAARVGTTQPTIHRIMLRGQHPGYEMGKRIVDLHAEVIGSGEEAA